METLSVTAACVGSRYIFMESFNASSKAVACPWPMGWPDPHTMVLAVGVTRKRLVVTLLCVSSAKAHITLISFPLFTHKTQSQVFRASPILAGQKSLGAKDRSFFFFFLISPSVLLQGHPYTHIMTVYLSICEMLIRRQITIFSL